MTGGHNIMLKEEQKMQARRRQEAHETSSFAPEAHRTAPRTEQQHHLMSH
ncbi:hypothetical protein [Larsenimonas rhizosphaerae]|uniref:Uncharacterized protein n=1 Tax=Larsenimonas rhizosphaerae TaxID=2944682 RepID=A0AA42CT99_9GAMM|nr:hypothetical protein [Larsenimonas rhizosphaerae]MCM2130713.1 hypothetical protein [Larsenimonas rhizosphaerae]MCX2523417.1 hypothetical protein [Larsenimonas rhizosphaerae]